MRLSRNWGLSMSLLLSIGCGQKTPLASTDPPPAVHPNPAQQVSVPPPAKEQPPKTLVQNVRAAALRPERQNELRQIGLFFRNFEIENNRNPRTDQEFIQYIQRDAPVIAKAIQDKYYILNLKVKMKGGSSGVIAWEYPADGPGHLVVRVDASVSPMSAEELKKALAAP